MIRAHSGRSPIRFRRGDGHLSGAGAKGGNVRELAASWRRPLLSDLSWYLGNVAYKPENLESPMFSGVLLHSGQFLLQNQERGENFKKPRNVGVKTPGQSRTANTLGFESVQWCCRDCRLATSWSRIWTGPNEKSYQRSDGFVVFRGNAQLPTTDRLATFGLDAINNP